MKKNKNIILNLIKDDLINTQLIDGLNTLGLDAGKYYLNISQSFFALMGFGDYDQETKLYNEYFDFSEKAMAKPFNDSEQLHILALEVYNKLLLEKVKRKKRPITQTEHF